jgi:hypothetical protein
MRCQSAVHGCRRSLNTEPREGGSNRRPLPLDPIPGSYAGPLKKGEFPDQPNAFSSGSCCIGIKQRLQAHFRIGKCLRMGKGANASSLGQAPLDHGG